MQVLRCVEKLGASNKESYLHIQQSMSISGHLRFPCISSIESPEK